MTRAAPAYQPFRPVKSGRRKPDLRYKFQARLYNCLRWRNESKRHIRENPTCVFCGGHLLDAKGEPIPQACVDHEPPHRGDERMFWDKRTWQSAHAACHNSKTARKDRGRK